MDIVYTFTDWGRSGEDNELYSCAVHCFDNDYLIHLGLTIDSDGFMDEVKNCDPDEVYYGSSYEAAEHSAKLATYQETY